METKMMKKPNPKKYYIIKGLNETHSFEVINLIPRSENLTHEQIDSLIKEKGLQLHRTGKDFEIYY
jgi:hypothetical protein